MKTRREIERLLESGIRLGFSIPLEDPEYLGWVLVTRLKPNPRVLELIDESDAPRAVARERQIERTPFLVLVLELRRDVHEAGGYETEEDYRRKDRYWFASLDEVEARLREWELELADAKDGREIDAP